MSKANLVLKFAIAVKEAAVAQEAVGVRYKSAVGSASQAVLGNRSQTSAGLSQGAVDPPCKGDTCDSKDQDNRSIQATVHKASSHGSPKPAPASIHPVFSSKPRLGMQKPMLDSSQSFLPQSAIDADIHGSSSAIKPKSGRHCLINKPMPGHHSLFHTLSRPKSTSSNVSIGFNKQIMTAANIEELLSLVEKAGEKLDFFNISSALSRVPKLVAMGGAGGSDKQQALGTTETHLVHFLATLMEQKLHTFDARGLANAAWAFGKLRYSPKQLPGLIAQRSLEKIQEFTPQNLSNMLWSHVYLQHRDEAFLKAAAGQVRAHITEFKPQELSNVVWAFASLSYRDIELLRDAAKQTIQLLDSFKEQELSNLVWAFARSEYRDPQLFNALLQPVMAKVATLSPQGVSNIAWGLSHVGLPNAAFVQAISHHWTGRLKEFDPQALSTLTWALGAAGIRNEPLLIHLMDECLRCRKHLAPQHLSNVLWACATLNFCYGTMLPPWSEAVMRAADHFEPQGLSNILWAFAKLGHFEARLLDRLAETLVSGKVDACSAQGLSNIIWAYATAGHCHTPLLTRLADRMAKAAPSFSAQNCSVSLWGLATLRHVVPETFELLLERLATEIQSGSRSVEPQNVANTLWACARMGHDLGTYAGILRDHALKQAGRMRQQELCNCFWALAVLDCLDVESFQKFCNHMRQAGGLSTEGLHQAFHAQLLFHSSLAHNSPTIPKPYPTLPEPLNSQAAAAWSHRARGMRVSRLQQDVGMALDAAAIPHRMEVLTDDALFSIDIVVEMPGELPAALEVDGMHHFASNPPGAPLRDVIMHRRLLQDRGWTVINLGFQLWNNLPGFTPQEKAPALQAYILRELKQAQKPTPRTYMPTIFHSPAVHCLPQRISPDALAYSSCDPCSSPLHLSNSSNITTSSNNTFSSNVTPNTSPFLTTRHGDLEAVEYGQDTSDLLWRMLTVDPAYAPAISANLTSSLNTLTSGIQILTSGAADWLPAGSAPFLYNLATWCPQPAAPFCQLATMTSPTMTMHSPFLPQVPAPFSSPPSHIPAANTTQAQCNPSLLSVGYQLAQQSNPEIGSLSLDISRLNLSQKLGLGWDNTPVMKDSSPNISNSFLGGPGITAQPMMQTMTPAPAAPPAASLLDSLWKMAANLPAQQDNSWAAVLAESTTATVAPSVPINGDVLVGAAGGFRHSLSPVGMQHAAMHHAPEVPQARAPQVADGMEMGWTVWNGGMPPVLSAGAHLL